jgi:tRNA(Ile)-lysidine synthase TilS/MesJ
MSNFRYDRNRFALNKAKELVNHHVVIHSIRPLKEWAIKEVVKAASEKGISILELKQALRKDIRFYGINYADDAGSLVVVHVY